MKKKHARSFPFAPLLEEQLKDPEFKKGFDEAYLEGSVLVQLAMAREKAQLTQEQLAQKANMKRQALNRIETQGQNLTLQTISRLAGAMGYNVEFKLVKSASMVADRNLPRDKSKRRKSA